MGLERHVLLCTRELIRAMIEARVPTYMCDSWYSEGRGAVTSAEVKYKKG